MSYGIQSAGLFGSTSTDGSSSISLRPFANLDLTEDQRKQIRSILKNADGEGLSQAQIQQQINAILTTTQQTTLQSDIAALNSNSSTGSNTGSTGTAGSPPPKGGNPFADPNGPFANLDLTSSQQTQIAQILQSARSQGLTLDQINTKIDAVLTSSQQATFETDLENLPQPPNGQSSSANDLLANLNLTSDQQSQIDSILKSAQSNGTSSADVLTQIEAILTPAQQSTLLQDVQTAQAIVSGRSQTGNGGTSASSATLSNGLTETDIQNQVAAATSLILKQFQNDVGAAT
jgi:Spy/CpxP family protein refolding chaperone